MVMNRIVLLLGSNIDKERNLPEAVRLLGEMAQVTAVSSVYETAPVGTRDQPSFLNAAVMVESPLSAAAFKQNVIDAVEKRLHRVRVADKNAARTIDVDIVLFNDAVLTYNGRSLPDPDLLRFVHVAVPVAELLPLMPHPVTGERLVDIASRLLKEAAQDGPLPIWKRPDVELDAGLDETAVSFTLPSYPYEVKKSAGYGGRDGHEFVSFDGTAN